MAVQCSPYIRGIANQRALGRNDSNDYTSEITGKIMGLRLVVLYR